MSELRELQERFANSLINCVDESYAQQIRENGLSGERRIGIYQHGVSLGMCDALGGVYEVTKKLVGDEYFSQVAEQYLRAYPSKTGNIHDFGAEFPAFLSAFPGLESLPYLPDVARLEWIYHSVFHSPMGELLNIEKLAQVPESRYDQLSLLLSSSCHLFYSDYPVLRIWQINQDWWECDDVVNLDEGGVILAIVREGKQIAFHTLEPAAFVMLDAISRSVKFDQACEMALRLDPDCNVGAVLQEAVLNRMIIGFSVTE